MILAGDVGGTKTVLAVFEETATGLWPVREETFSTRQYRSLEDVLEVFLVTAGRPKVHAACVGVAGPVVAGRSQGTNLPWEMEERAVATALDAPGVKLLNDLEAAAYGMLYLEPEELCALQAGEDRKGNIAVIAAGTGLGEAILFWDGARYAAIPSEGGHADFAPRTDLEIALLRFLQREFGHVSYERVVSGPGLANIYRFLREGQSEPEQASVRDRMGQEDPAAVITELGLADADPLCRKALDMFVSIYGAAAGNLALKVFAIGGVFVGGGIAPKILSKMQDGAFTTAFRAKGRFADLMSSIPIHVALNPRAPLIGAAHVARELAAGAPARADAA